MTQAPNRRSILTENERIHRRFGRGPAGLGRPGRQGRVVGGLYAASAAVLIVAVLAVAYGSQAPSLAVAEFAPAARASIEAPPTTAPDQGRSSGGSTRSRVTTTTAEPTVTSGPGQAAPTAPTTKVSRSRTCIGAPARQTEDPMSPPCVATIFEGDNGGATGRGVTATEILVAVPVTSASTATTGYYRRVNELFDYFNRRFELYGRRMRAVYVSGSLSGVTAQRAYASDIAATGAFASLDYPADYLTPSTSWHHELGRNGLVTIVGRENPQSDATLYDELHPYLWSVYPSIETIWQATANLVCGSMVGHPAIHAGPALSGLTRKFGVVVEQRADPPVQYASQRLVQQLQACGADPVVTSTTSPSGDRVAGQSLKDKGVTTLLCACATGRSLLDLATAVGNYEPEFLLTEFLYPAEWTEYEIGDPRRIAQAAHAMAVRLTPKAIPYQGRPFFGTMIEATGGSFAPSNTDQNREFFVLESLYRELMVLASGIQAAGPQLSADTFAQGLMATQFPNSGCGQPPLGQPCVGFGPGDHSFFDDFALTSWNPTISSDSIITTATPRPGGWCYIGAGTRFRPATMPADADRRFFNPAEPCR